MKHAFTITVACASVVSLLSTAALAGPTGYSVQSNGNDHLYSIDLMTGVSTDLGALNFGDAEGTAFVGSQLHSIGGTVAQFWNITTPPGVLVGGTGSRNGLDAGLSYDTTTGTLYNMNGASGSSTLYTINVGTGAATPVGSNNIFADGLAINAAGAAFAVDGIFSDSLYSVNLGTGAVTLIGGLGVGSISVQSGLSFAGDGTLWWLTSAGNIYTINTGTGLASLVAQTQDVAGAPLNNWESLAIASSTPVPEPGTLALFGIGLGGLGIARRRRSKKAVA